MYVHIGKDCIISSADIIGIFDISILEKNRNIQEICKELKIDKNIIDVSENNQKTLVLIKGKKEAKGYISNISSSTLAKRAQMENIQ